METSAQPGSPMVDRTTEEWKDTGHSFYKSHTQFTKPELCKQWSLRNTCNCLAQKCLKGAVHIMSSVSEIQWQPFCLATQLYMYPQNAWLGWVAFSCGELWRFQTLMFGAPLWMTDVLLEGKVILFQRRFFLGHYYRRPNPRVHQHHRFQTKFRHKLPKHFPSQMARRKWTSNGNLCQNVVWK